MNSRHKYINREITWLGFNARVLQEARDKTVPLLERLRFMGIYSNNLDEFYKVRYATVLRALQLDQSAYSNIIKGQSVKTLLNDIKKTVALQQETYDATYEEILAELRKEDIYFINDEQVYGKYEDYIKSYYQNKLSHTIAVYLWEPNINKIPELKEGANYLAEKMVKYSDTESNTIENNGIIKKIKEWISLDQQNKSLPTNTYAIIEVPTHLFSRFVVLPKDGNKNYIMMLEDVVRYNLNEIFDIFDYDHIEAHSFKSSKDAGLDLDQDVQESFMERISKSVERRRRGEPVRLVYDKEMSEDMLNYLKQILHIDPYDTLSPGGKYNNKRDFIGFPNLGRFDLEFEAIKPLTPPALKNVKSYIKAIEEQDHMLYAPYVDYSVLLKFLREAAIDPRVKSIKMTVYRVAKKSQIMSALINAAKNGKKVTAVLELRARFDEANNVNWSKTLQDEGVQVIFGVADLKVHSKVGLVTYHKDGKEKQVSFISTGNFHEKTARIYTDFTLLTAREEITKEVAQVFDFFEFNYKIKPYKHLIVSPIEMRNKLYKLIRQEIENKKKGKPAQINIKVNSLSDKRMIDKLYEASRAGVEIRLVIRGICCLLQDVPNLSENIKAISVIDKFLEHPRIYWFKNAGEDIVYISSADLMPRNIDHRVEVGCPIYDKEIKKQVMDTFDLSFNDNVKGRIQNNENGEYQKNNLPRNRSQISIYEYYKKLYNEDN